MADEPKKILPASEILERIKDSKPVECDNVILEGDLDIGMLELQTQKIIREKVEPLKFPETAKIVASSLQITNEK